MVANSIFGFVFGALVLAGDGFRLILPLDFLGLFIFLGLDDFDLGVLIGAEISGISDGNFLVPYSIKDQFCKVARPETEM